MRRLQAAKTWRWNRQQRRAVIAIASALVGPSGIFDVPHVMHMRTLERGYALAARIRRDAHNLRDSAIEHARASVAANRELLERLAKAGGPWS
jgi:hypothetical protein